MTRKPGYIDLLAALEASIVAAKAERAMTRDELVAACQADEIEPATDAEFDV
jgi:hypothetical protein